MYSLTKMYYISMEINWNSNKIRYKLNVIKNTQDLPLLLVIAR